MTAKKLTILLAHAFAGWLLCDLTIYIGKAITGEVGPDVLIVDAIGAPVYFFLVSLVYFRRFNFTTPLKTAVIFTAFVMIVDFLLVALVINKSLDMFTSLLGTWLPFGLIFSSTYLTGVMISKAKAQKMAAM